MCTFFFPGAVRKNIRCREATDSDIESIVKRWLQLASDRNGGRRAREARLPPRELPEDAPWWCMHCAEFLWEHPLVNQVLVALTVSPCPPLAWWTVSYRYQRHWCKTEGSTPLSLTARLHDFLIIFFYFFSFFPLFFALLYMYILSWIAILIMCGVIMCGEINLFVWPDSVVSWSV